MSKITKHSYPGFQWTSFISTVMLLLASTAAFGQESEQYHQNTERKWAIGTSITYPMADIYMMQASYSPWKSGDILGGLAFQNWTNDQGQANAYTVLLGYRQYLWNGLHAEMELWPAYNPFRSAIDDHTYAGLELWMSLRIGYRVKVHLVGREFFILAQPSIGFGVARDNPWPQKAKGDGAVLEPQVILGVRL